MCAIVAPCYSRDPVHYTLLFFPLPIHPISEHVFLLLCRYAVPNLVHINIAHGFICRRICLGAEIHKRHAIYFSGE